MEQCENQRSPVKHEVTLVLCNACERIMLIFISARCQSIQMEVRFPSMPQFTRTTDSLILCEIWGEINFLAFCVKYGNSKPVDEPIHTIR